MVDVDSPTSSKHLQVQVEQYMASQICKRCCRRWGIPFDLTQLSAPFDSRVYSAPHGEAESNEMSSSCPDRDNLCTFTCTVDRMSDMASYTSITVTHCTASCRVLSSRHYSRFFTCNPDKRDRNDLQDLDIRFILLDDDLRRIHEMLNQKLVHSTMISLWFNSSEEVRWTHVNICSLSVWKTSFNGPSHSIYLLSAGS